jgi:RNA polymerase sigma-70 factor (ECF subfamily)
MVYESQINPAPGSTSSGLLNRVKAGQAEAWGRLIDLYGPLIYQWCRQSGLQSQDAADVGQEVFATVARRIAEFRKEQPADSFRGWLWTVTRNKIRDHFRARKRHPQARGGTDAQQHLAAIPEPPEDPPTAIIGDRPDDGLEHRAIEIVSAGVEEQTWRAFWRYAIDGRTAGEVADELKISVQAVYTANFRVRRKLREELEDLMD